MRWEDERYVRLYTKNTPGWCIVPWQARAILPLVLRSLDRAGIVELGDDGFEGLAVMVQIPLDVVEVGMRAWLARGTFELRGTTLVMPKFLDAQEAKASDVQRAREKRARDRDRANAITARDETVTHRDDTSRNVTKSHAGSRGVTLNCAVPSLAVPILDPPIAPPRGAPATEQRASGTRGSRLAADWSPSVATLQRFRKQERVDALASLERFRNHWLAKSGPGSAKVDWERTFVNWVLEDIARGRATPSVAADEWQPESAPDPEASAEVSARAADLFATLAKSKSPDAPVDDRPSGLVAVGIIPARKPGT